jgi:hypothetical protein
MVGVEESIVNALFGLRIRDQLFKCYVFTRVVRSQSSLERLLRGEILKNTRYILYICILRQMALTTSQPFQTEPLCLLIAHNMQ